MPVRLRGLTLICALVAAFTGCNPPTKIISPGTLGQPVSVNGDLQVVLRQPDSSNTDIYAAVFAALETTTVVFCAGTSSAATATCEGKKTYQMTFQKREENGFYFISPSPLSFKEGTDLLFVSYISNNGDKPSQRGRATYFDGKVQSDNPLNEDSVTDTSGGSDNSTTTNTGNGGIDAGVLVDLFKQILGAGGSGTTTVTPGPSTPVTPVPTTPVPTPPVVTGTGQTDALVPNPDNVPLSASEFEVIRLTNAERQRQGKTALIVQNKIMLTSRESSRLMKQQNNMVHGLTSGWNGENIAQGYSSPDQVVQGWINSPGHYRNMMGGFKYIGVGDTKEQGGSVYWTQQFNY
jgi:uncharacterized protein YkwD